MKCQVCDSDYPDDWVTCPKDGNDLRASTPMAESLGPDRDDDMIVPVYGAPPMDEPEEPLARRPRPELLAPAYGMPPQPVDAETAARFKAQDEAHKAQKAAEFEAKVQARLDARYAREAAEKAAAKAAEPPPVELMVAPAYGMAAIEPPDLAELERLRAPPANLMAPAYGIPPIAWRKSRLIPMLVLTAAIIAIVIAAIILLR